MKKDDTKVMKYMYNWLCIGCGYGMLYDYIS